VRFAAGLISSLLLLGIAGILYVYSGAFDVAASSLHSDFERELFSTVMKHSVTVKAESDDPLPVFTDRMIMDGFEHYDEMCITCHGAPGIERSEIGQGLNPPPPSLSYAVKAWTPAQLFWIIKHGLKMTGMPSFGATHSDQQVWSIVAFVEKLAGMSSEQYQEMRQRSDAETHEHHNEEPH